MEKMRTLPVLALALLGLGFSIDFVIIGTDEKKYELSYEWVVWLWDGAGVWWSSQ